MLNLIMKRSVKTRFGLLNIDNENMLLYIGKPLIPPLRGNTNLDIVRIFHNRESDIVVVQDTGGGACPAQFSVVAVSAVGAKATPEFGTCSDKASITQDGDAVSIEMSGYAGPFESEAEKDAASKEKHVFLYNNGLIIEDGKQDRGPAPVSSDKLTASVPSLIAKETVPSPLAEPGSPESEYQEGAEAFDRHEYARALDSYRGAANQGFAPAQNRVGFLYQYALGVSQDFEAAMNWYRKAAAQGYAKAQYNIGVMYQTGAGVPKDDSQARYWYGLAAAQGYEPATSALHALK